VTSLVAADDNQYLRIDHGQDVTLSFQFPAVPSGYKREIILHLKGTYEHITAPFTADPIAGRGLPWGFQGVFPNPTTGRTRVQFKANGVGRCVLAVYDVGGRRVRTLMDDPGGQAVLVNTEWDGYNDRGKRVASGVYFMRLQEGKENEAEKLVVLR
jgi:hypothetical protein